MPDNIRTFKAATVEDALAQIRREMGHDAVVVETKQIARRSLLPWCTSRQEFEVTAAQKSEKRRSRSKRRSSETQTSATTTPNSRPIAVTLADLRRAAETAGESRATTASATKDLVDRIASSASQESITPEPSPSNLSDVLLGTVTPTAASDIEQRLESLQQMIAELGRRTRPRGLVEIPPELFAHYLSLIEADVEDEIARELIAKLQQHAAPGQLAETSTTTSLLAALIERELRCAEPLIPKQGRRQIAMLVGPTGVGKTTTIAKLAGRFGMNGDLRVGLITVDTYRVAAVDQLRTYAEIIDLPMQVVTSPEQLSSALDLFAEFDLVLIDTAGRSPHDDRRLEELKQLVDAAAPDHIYLVLSLAAGAKSLRAAADRFAAVRPTSLVLTKLDEAVGCGVLLSTSRDIALPVTYLTAGQEVPRDIEPANPCRMARLIIGRDQLGTPEIGPMGRM
jgi:flagellar biosynthesis protein FlhF